MEPAGGDVGKRKPQRGGGGGVHPSPRAAARIHPLPIQSGNHLHQPGSAQVTETTTVPQQLTADPSDLVLVLVPQGGSQ